MVYMYRHEKIFYLEISKKNPFCGSKCPLLTAPAMYGTSGLQGSFREQPILKVPVKQKKKKAQRPPKSVGPNGCWCCFCP